MYASSVPWVRIPLSPPQKRSPSGSFFCGGESGITHLCIFKCTGCASLQSKPDEPDKSNGVESLNKIKVCAGIEVVANDPTHLINPSSRFGGSVLSAKPRPKEPERLFFCGGESGITHLCNFKCTGCASLRRAQT